MINLRGLVLLAAGAMLMPGASAQTHPSGTARAAATAEDRPAGKLVLHRPVERELGAGQTDVFTLDVAAGLFLHVEADKKGVDMAVVLAGPEGKPLVTADSPNGGFGPVSASLIADRGGVYRIRVVKSPRSSETGRYRIDLTDLHAPTEQDRTRLRAETEFYAAVAGDRAQDREKRLQAAAGYERAAALWRSLGNDRDIALCLHRIGTIYDGLGETQKALDYYNQALPLRRAAGDGAGEAATLNGIGNVYSHIGETQKALDFYNRAQTLRHAQGDRGGEAATLGNIGVVYRNVGENRKALDAFNQVLPLMRTMKDRRGEAITLNNMGGVYFDLGEKRKALEYFSRALPLNRAIGERLNEAGNLNNIGQCYADLGDKRKALDEYNQALPLWRALGYRAGEAWALQNAGEAYADLGEKQKALEYYSQALPLNRAAGDRATETVILNNIGEAYSDLGRKELALSSYTQALQLARAVSSPSSQGLVLGNLMRFWQADRPALAIFFGKQAVNQYQDLRRNIQGLDPQLQQSYLATVTKTYRSLADLLIAQGRLSEAEQILSLLKEQEYFDYVRRAAAEASSVEGHANLNAEEAEWERRYREIADRLAAAGNERVDLLAKKARTREETLRLDRIEADVAADNMAFGKFFADLAQRFSGKPAGTLHVEQLPETKGITEDLRALPAGTVAIYTLVGEDMFRSILLTPDLQTAYEYPIRAEDLNRKVLAFRQVAKDPTLDPRPLAEDLYKILIGPMAEGLRQAKAQTLMWSLDGVLRYLPLAALYDGKQYLIERYRVSVMTLASNTQLKDRPDAVWKGAGFGVTKAYEGLPPLPLVSAELEGIIATKPGDSGVLTGEIKLNEAFTQQAMRETLMKGYPVVHIASHFLFQPGNETQSYLLLGDGSHLSMEKLKTSANLFGGVQLLTLSACNTGMGDGTEVEGFGAMAQRQGAKAVIASLWPVADASTKALMQKFYRIREASPGKTKLEALREAQLELLGSTAKRAGSAEPVRALSHEGAVSLAPIEAPRFRVDPLTPYAHPYYWAPFFLMGNWL
ncbi:MAG: CHAT domain-containing protein [Bryobacteraceae bacterium]|jgi:CHAT domain-containing protein/Tfp pilus assembly protein PilF